MSKYFVKSCDPHCPKHPMKPLTNQDNKPVKAIMVFANGNVVVFGEDGEQMPEHQKGIVNYAEMNRLALLAKDNDIAIEIQGEDLFDWRNDLRQRINYANERYNEEEV